MTTPNWVSNRNCHVWVAVTAGVAHARSSPIRTVRRIRLPSLFSSRATNVPRSIVASTHTAVKTMVRITTVQKNGSDSILV